MLTPQELYYQYSTDPCEDGTKGLGNEYARVGKGTPYDLQKLANFLKQLKYPCFTRAPYTQVPSNQNGISHTGDGKVALPFRFLQRLDVEAFTEIQPDIKSGTSHAIRNACDVMRACFLESRGQRLQWEHRSAPEHMEYFGKNSITDCLMVLGPDLVSESEAELRGTGCGPLDCLNAVGKLPNSEGVALGGPFDCIPLFPPGSLNNRIGCSTCDFCPEDDPDDPCCKASGCEGKVNICCHDTPGTRKGIWDYKDIFNENNPERPLKHIGILKRKSYGGYVNLLNNSGPNFYACPGDILLKYFQSINQYDYSSHKLKSPNTALPLGTEYIQRVKTISLVLPSSVSIVQQIKDLIYNGYGVVLMSNIGFPNKRDSSGLSYPDRIWYHTYAVIGYDDRKTEYNECVYLLANSWGRWNSGGHPSWGPIPDGSFLVTESHLSCMTTMFRSDQKGCRTTTKIEQGSISTIPGCFSNGIDNSCSPWDCDQKQKATGMVFALSLSDGFPKQNLDYTQFYGTRENS